AQVAALGGYYARTLTAMAEHPHQPYTAAALLSTAERQQLVTTWNATHTAYDLEQPLPALFDARATGSPETIALLFEDQHLTYAELQRRATQLAHHLQRLGVGPEVLVGVCLERSLEMVIALYAIVKAGGAYVPLDPTYPPERLAYMLADAHAAVLLTQARFAEQVPPASTHILCLDRDWERIAQEREEPLAYHLRPENLAYMIYTSGSTGLPKGALNTHRGIVNRLLWMQTAYQLTPADVVLQKTPFSFDVSVWEFFWPLLAGARLVLARPEGHKDSRYLIDLIEQAHVTTLHFVPSMLQVFLTEPDIARCHSLRQVMCSGEALPFALQERFFSRLSAALHNLYGPTEAAVDVTHWTCQPHNAAGLVPIGRPIANTQLYILDAHLEPVPVGAPGELYLAGVGVGRGYHLRPALTAERFLPNPFSTELGTRLYRTGDLARYLPDGSVDFLGRADFQVKIRGFRIELGEVEAALREHPHVQDALVLAREGEAGKRLVAYLVPHPEAAPTVSDLRRFLQAKLPEYMLPAAFVAVPAWPLSPNGKLDRKALPAPEVVRPALDHAFVPPRTPQEKILADLWAEVLRREPIGVHDNFLELGGDSILS
ncbi:hypothetical protein BURC_02063, partial [Burkholderiaceae bacterium]